MRERHNIVGSEVGRPRPPIYRRTEPPLQPRRRGRPARVLLMLALLVLVLVLAGAALAVMSQGLGPRA